MRPSERGKRYAKEMLRLNLQNAKALGIEKLLVTCDVRNPTIRYFHPMQTYYFGELIEEVGAPTEKDHVLCWIEYEQLRGKLFVEMQNWALEQAVMQRTETNP